MILNYPMISAVQLSLVCIRKQEKELIKNFKEADEEEEGKKVSDNELVPAVVANAQSGEA